MITIHHLCKSQSDRVVWLMEELNLPYKLKWYERGPDLLAPKEFLALHPVATAPVIEDDGQILVESGVIVEHICHRHAGGRFTVGADQSNYTDYLYWMHFNNNVLGLFFAKTALGAEGSSPQCDMMRKVIERREASYFQYLDQCLSRSAFAAGSEFTCADVMVMFNVASLPLFGGFRTQGMPNIQAYMKRIEQRPAYQKAMQIAGPGASAPAV